MSMFRFIRFSVAALSLGLIASACGSTPINPTPAAPTLTPIGQPLPIETIAPTSTPPPNGPVTLTVWAPLSFAPGSDSPAQKILAQQLQSIDARVQVLPKKDHGAGGLLDLLTTASPVAPSILPDVIALDETDLETAARSGLLQPIDDLISIDLAGDLYPFARDLASIDGKLYGVIYSADIEHAAFITRTIEPAPIAWSDLISGSQRYLFAAHDGDVGISNAVLSQYLSAGGTLLDADQHPFLDQDALTQLLELYQRAQRNHVLASNILDLNSEADAWNAFTGSNSALANVSASMYLSEAQSLPGLRFAALPAIDQPAPPIARGWALAIVTRDPKRQIAAMKWIEALLSPDRSGAWTQAAKVLPGRVSALKQWNQNDPYTGFIGDQLQRAVAAPSMSIMSVVGPALRKAIDDVLSNRATPIDAAQAAVSAVNQK